MKKEKRNRVKGIFGTVLFHALLLLLLSLPFMSLTYQDPPPKKGGGSITIDFRSQKATESETEEVVEAAKEVVTQTTTDAIAVKKEDSKKEVIVEEEQKVNPRAIYSGKKTTVTFEGRNDDDDLAGDSLTGDDYQLRNRRPIFLPEPIYDSEAEGKVIVRIIVDKNGNVISAITDIGTTLNNQLLVRAKEAAFKTKYPPKADAPNQHGKLIYTFEKN